MLRGSWGELVLAFGWTIGLTVDFYYEAVIADGTLRHRQLFNFSEPRFRRALDIGWFLNYKQNPIKGRLVRRLRCL